MSKKPIPDHLVSQWHPTLNGEKKPEQFAAGTRQKIWWQCSLGHEWEATISNRTAKVSTNCPYCSGKKVLIGYNDLATLNRPLAKLWHPTKNGILTPQQVTVRSGKKVWWLGECGHEWIRTIDRSSSSYNCIYCVGKAVLKGFNDISTTHPSVALEFNYSKNGDIDIDTLIAGSHKKIWWQCSLGHEWETSVKHRCYSKSNCPVCSGQKIVKGFNDIVTTHPSIAAKFHPTLNGSLKVTDITFGKSNQKIWWQCSHDPKHYWLALPPDISRGQGCAICANRQIIQGINDLQSTNPLVAAQWHPTKNGILTPTQISQGSNLTVWWLCHKGHETQTTISSRNSGSKCGKCIPTVSLLELEVLDFVKELCSELKILTGDRELLKGKELDIYVPEKNIAIEFNGVYWHSEKYRSKKSYHYDKWLACKEAGVQLIQVWEDEWNTNPDQIKRMLAHKLGFSNQRKVFARKTKVVCVDIRQATEFLDVNHVQGFASGSHYLGLVEKNDVSEEILALLVLKKEAGTDGKVLNIIRYATSANVVGGFTKLLSYATTEYSPESFITFADHCVSDGGLYENNGFVADKELSPDYMYVVNGERKHKFGYRLKRFKNDPNLLWEEGLTERELAALNGLDRIWDAGKTRYRYTVKTSM